MGSREDLKGGGSREDLGRGSREDRGSEGSRGDLWGGRWVAKGRGKEGGG